MTKHKIISTTNFQILGKLVEDFKRHSIGRIAMANGHLSIERYTGGEWCLYYATQQLDPVMIRAFDKFQVNWVRENLTGGN